MWHLAHMRVKYSALRDLSKCLNVYSRAVLSNSETSEM